MRELQNRVQRAVVLAEGLRLTAQDMDLEEVSDALPPRTLKEARERVEREVIESALQRHDGKITAVARELGVSRPALYGMLEKLGIVRE